MFFRRKQHSARRPSKVGVIASVLQIKKFSLGELKKQRGSEDQAEAVRGTGVNTQVCLAPKPGAVPLPEAPDL